MSNFERKSPSLAFVIPHFRSNPDGATFIQATLQSLLDQTDPDWSAVIVSDGCTQPACQNHIAEMAAQHPNRISVLYLPQNSSTGYARNSGIRQASSLGADFILFQDDDDLADPRRVEVTRSVFLERRDVDFIYSGFIPIDEQNRIIDRSSVRLDMLEVLEALDREIVEGEGAWIKIATSTGFIATTSTVAVRTKLALDVPFPYGCYSEDSHTWLRMSAFGAKFHFASEIPTRYRMPAKSMTTLGRNGREGALLEVKVENDVDGFVAAAKLAVERGEVSPTQLDGITEAFLLRLASCIERQGGYELAATLRNGPRNFSDLSKDGPRVSKPQPA